MTSSGLTGLDSRNSAASIRQILAGIIAHANRPPIVHVFTQVRRETGKE
jgi:hypothetical protein